VPKTLLEVKRRISDAVLDLNGVSGVGVRGRSVVVYLESDDAGTRARVEKMTARLARIPQLADVPYPVTMEPHLVVEFYSR